MEKTYSRQVSDSERLWILMDKMCPPYANQMILEGHGHFDIIQWEKAVQKASEVNPGSRVKHKGGLKFSTWVDSGRTPPVKVVDGRNWSGFDPDHAPFLKSPLCIKKGAACEVVLVNGNENNHVIFRTSHAVMDGRGTMTWAKDIFRVLRGEAPKGSYCTMTDAQLAKTFQDKYRTPFPEEHIAPTGKASSGLRGVTWRRLQLKGKYSKILPQIIMIAAKEAWKNSDGIVRFGIPVDLRRRKEGLRSTGNLSIAIYIEINKNSTVESIANDIKNQINDKKDGVLTDGQMMFEYSPVWLMKIKVEQILKNQQKKGLYSLSGIASNPGAITPSAYAGGGFQTKSCFFIPPGIEALPFFLGISGMGDKVEVVVTLPEALAGNKRIENMMNSIEMALVRKEDKSAESIRCNTN